jgi:hypothetical protein
LAQVEIIKNMQLKEKPNIYKQAQRFAEITIELIVNGNIKRAKHCLQIAGNQFNAGTLEIKNAISNVYLYSVSSFLEGQNCRIKNFLPQSLENEYHSQINASGV